MAYTKEDLVDSISRPEKVVETRSSKGKLNPTQYSWWLAQSDQDLTSQLLATMGYLKRTNQFRIRQASIFTRLFTGKPLYNYMASTSSLDQSNQLPIGRPTANVCYSCTDTLTSRITEDVPNPVFLTDGGDYAEQMLGQEANRFIQGELYRLKADQIIPMQFRDGCVLGNGFLKHYPNFKTGKVCVDKVIETELLVDFNDAYYGNPRQLIHPKLCDRAVLADLFEDKADLISIASKGNVDQTPRSTETISDQIIVCEGWHLPSGEGAKDGRHVIACSEGIILDESWDRSKFPFVKFGYNPHIVGWFAQGLIEILMPTQMEIYRMLIVASQAIELMGVPRIFIDELSAIMETSFNNRIGTIIKGRGNPPEFINATANSPEIYQWIQWLIANAFQMSGLSQLAAAGVKPQGLNSGEAQREFLATQDERFGAVLKRYRNIYPDLSYGIIEDAKEIVEKTGKYTTVYPGKDGLREVDLKRISRLIDDTYVIQCFDESSLPKDPAGRQAAISEKLAAGEITINEYRRLSNYPDLKESDRLALSLEDRIKYSLNEIIENGMKNFAKIAPDVFILDPTDMATDICTKTINLYSRLKLEEEKMQGLRDWFTLVQNLKKQAMPPPQIVPQTGTAGAQQPQIQPPNPSIAPTSGAQV